MSSCYDEADRGFIERQLLLNGLSKGSFNIPRSIINNGTFLSIYYCLISGPISRNARAAVIRNTVVAKMKLRSFDKYLANTCLA